MDTSRQLYDVEATGRQRGVYDDIKRTFRAPIVNWIFRTTMANAPHFLRYAWGQLKPLFDTRAFARYSVAYRDAVLTELEDATGIPTYRRSTVDVAPAEYDALRGQLATFDVVAPRLVFLFETMDRALHDGAVGTDPGATRAATAPFPAWLDADRGRPPTMIAAGAVPDDLDETVSSIQSFHGLGDDLPSIYRCLAQWPTVLDAAWADLGPFFESDGFDRARETTAELTATLVESTPYTPRLAPEDLRSAGFDDDTIEEMQTLFREFNTGAVESVLPTLPVYAATVDAEGVRNPL
ncbi:halocarboxylic acid dehydrogenase DehI family protein [Halococcus agarilyticus]|uniref:halocarboxylic acid dehydrogenase DehI family protein n=1 Tax=Halococcus agarilyticus TaxID=1232219 RepID=UPI000678174D|nr:halocarboxylic acid dehydrogenase DehI family protein [Halococcus agarilyticus]